jgi:hypothetical protein
MQGRRVHVIGAGLAGLAAAVRLAKQGAHVRLYEAAQNAGGRCRSYVDAELGCRVDNGNHLVVSGNDAAMAYVAEIGAAATFIARDMAEFPFVDLKTGERWSVRPTDHRLPWWILLANRRVAGSHAWDYLQALKLRGARIGETVREVLPDSVLYERLWRPLTVAALNTQPDEASARLLWDLFSETFGRGGAALHALLPREGLSESLVDPALAVLAGRGAQVSFGHRLRSLTVTAGAVASLDFGAKGQVDVAADEPVLLAVNAPVAVDLLPDLVAPTEFRALPDRARKRGSQQFPRRDRRHGRVGVREARSRLRHHLRGGASDRPRGGGSRPGDLARRAARAGAWQHAHAAMAHCEREARHLRCDARAAAPAARPCDSASQHVPGR